MIREFDSVEYWKDQLGTAQPLYTHWPTPGSPNELAKCEKVAGVLGIKLLPWQRFFLRLITEKLPSGAYRFQTVLLTVSRQCGKSTVLKVLACTRALMYKEHRTYFTAQSNKDAYEHIINEFWKQISGSILSKTAEVRRGTSSPKINFNNGSYIAPFTPSPEGVHGRNFQLGIIDECFAYDIELGNGILGAVGPAQITHVDKQLLMLSTKGTSDSTFLNPWLEKGRLATEDPHSTLAFTEWAMADGLDPFDMANYGFHPGVQGGLITLDDIAALAGSLSPGEFRRSMANIPTIHKESVFDMELWDSMLHSLPRPVRSKVGIGYEVKANREKSAIVAAYYTDEGKVALKVLNNATGSDWLKEFIPLYADARPLAIAADKHPQNNVITDALRMDYPHIDIQQLSAADWNTAAASFKSLVEEKGIIHDGHLALRDAVATAVTKPYGDSGFSFSHLSNPELAAAIVAIRMIQQVEVQQKPFIYMGS